MTLARFTGMCAIALVGSLGAPALADTDAALTRYWERTNQSMPPNMAPDVLADLFAENAVLAHPFAELPDGPLEGRDAIVAFLSSFDDKFDSWTHVEERRFIDGDTATWEGYGRGVAKMTGKAIELPMVFTITFDDDGRILEERAYFRLETLMAAMN